MDGLRLSTLGKDSGVERCQKNGSLTNGRTKIEGLRVQVIIIGDESFSSYYTGECRESPQRKVLVSEERTDFLSEQIREGLLNPNFKKIC